MPWYDGNIPTLWKTALEKMNGAEFVTEVIFDPDGENILFAGKYDISDISPIRIIKDLDPEFGITPTVSDIMITFNDPDGYFNPEKTNSLFYNYTPVGKPILIRLKNVTEATLQTITVFYGRINSLPVLTRGFSSLSCSDSRKYILNQKLTGADSSSAKKLMTINSVGGLVDSVTYLNTWNAPPYDFEVSGGSLPTGLTLSSLGVISGTPTESGTFNFTVKATNANGEFHAIDCELYVDPNLNDDFTSALGLGDYTEVDKGLTTSLAARESWYRVTVTGNHEWDADSDDAPHLYLDGASGLSGDWTIYGKVNAADLDGQNANYVGVYVRTGTNEGYICGCRTTSSAGTYGASVYRVSDENLIDNTVITTGEIWVKIKKVSTLYSFYYKEAIADSWTLMTTNSTESSTPTQVGFMIMCDVSGSGYGEIDKMYYSNGVLDFSTSSSLPTAAKEQVYSVFLKVTGGGGQYTYAVTSGALPEGLTLTASTGEISGTPTDARVSSFSITVTDGNGGTLEEDFVLVVSDTVYIIPSVLPDAYDSTAYSESFTIYGSGTFDRSVVTVGSLCALGKWQIVFTSTTAFNISGPDISNTTGSINSEFTETSVLTIPTTAWDGNFRKDDVIEFVTGRSYENQNAVSILYALYIAAGIENKELNCSSFFGSKDIGTLNTEVAASGTSIDINVDFPTLIKTGETITLTFGTTTEDVTVTTGNTNSTSYPPYTTLTVSALSNPYPSGATVTWKARGTKDTIDYSFDYFWNYCDLNNFNQSITFDRDINILQALELISIHAGIYGIQSRGIENIAGLIKRWTESLDEIDNSVLLSGTTNINSMEVFNSFRANYGYDYIEKEFTKTYIYPETDAANTSLTTHGYKREKVLDLPGYYSQDVVKQLLTYLYSIFANGLKIINFETDFKTFSTLIGERYDLDSPYPDIETEIEIFGYTLNIFKKYSVVLNVVDRSHLTETEGPFLLMADGEALTMPGGVKVKLPDRW